MDSRGAPARPRVSPAAVLAALSLLTNLLGYGFTVVMSRALPVARFGELAALVGVMVTASVIGTAMQAVIARRIAGGERPAPERLLTDAVVMSVGVGVVTAALSPALRGLLDLDSYGPVLWLAAAMVPTTFAYGVQGLLQGEHRLVRLGVVLAAVQGAKLLAGIGAAWAGGGVALAFGLTAVFTTVVAAAAIGLATPLRFGRPTWTRALSAAFLRDAGAVLGVLVLTSLDLLLARRYLDAETAGLYAAGNVVTRGAFWAPAFIALAGYARFSDPAARASALRRATSLLAAISTVAVLGSLLLRDLLPLVLGEAYRPVAPWAWLFAAQGAGLAALQLVTYAGIAVHDRRPAVALWVVAVAQVTLVAVVWHGSLAQVLIVATVCSWSTVAAGVALLAIRSRHEHRERHERTAQGTA